MGLLACVYDSPLGNCSNNGVSANAKQVCLVNVDGPFNPSDDAPAVELILGRAGNVIARPVGLEKKWTMFGGAFVYSSDSRFNEAVRKLAAYDFGFPVALHDRVE